MTYLKSKIITWKKKSYTIAQVIFNNNPFEILNKIRILKN